MDVGVKIYLSLDDGMQFVYLSQAGTWSMPVRSVEWGEKEGKIGRIL